MLRPASGNVFRVKIRTAIPEISTSLSMMRPTQASSREGERERETKVEIDICFREFTGLVCFLAFSGSVLVFIGNR